EYLRRHNYLMKAAVDGEPAPQGGIARQRSRLWELADLSANEFADEVARFAGLERVILADILSAPALNDGFSQRFLREMMVFPYQAAAGRLCTASDRAHRHRYPCGDHADAAWRIRSHPHPAEGSWLARRRKAWIFAARRNQAEAIAQTASRHDRRYRPDRKRQDHDVGDGPVDPEQTGPQNPDHRRPRRI